MWDERILVSWTTWILEDSFIYLFANSLKVKHKKVVRQSFPLSLRLLTEKNVQVGQCSCLLLNIPKQAKETQLLQSYYCYKQAALCETQAGGS